MPRDEFIHKEKQEYKKRLMIQISVNADQTIKTYT